MPDTAFAVNAITWVAVEVAKGTLGEATKSLWQSIVSSYQRWRGAVPEPGQIDSAVAAELLARETSLASSADVFFEQSPVLQRQARSPFLLRSARILWIDDNPAWNTLERQKLAEFGATLVMAESTQSAIAVLSRERFDVIISDIGRGSEPTRGLDDLQIVRSSAQGAPVVLYVGSLRGGTPDGAFGITNEPSELLHLLMDTRERVANVGQVVT